MSTTKLAIDGLWQCLCPSFSSRSLLKLSSRPTVLRQTPCLRSTRSSARTASNARKKAIEYHHENKVSPREGWRDLSRDDTGHGEARARPAGLRRHRNESLELDNEPTSILYGLLRTSASHGNALEVQRIVEHLVKERQEQPNLRLYGALILVNVNPALGSVFRLRSLLEEMEAEGLPMDTGICHDALKVLSVHPDYLLRADILEHMQQRWITVNEMGQHSVVAGLLREGQLEIACEWLARMRKENIRIDPWLYDMAVYLLVDGGEIDEARQIMKDRLEEGELDISKSVWNHLLDGASAAHDHTATVLAWNSQVSLGYINPPSGLCFNVLATAARAGDTVLASDVFRTLGQRATVFTTAHYEQLHETYLTADPPDLRAALAVITIMAGAGLEPTTTSTRQLFVFLKEGPYRAQEALAMLHTLQKQGRKVPLAALNVVLEVFVTQKDFDNALILYKSMHEFEPSKESDQPRRPMADVNTFNILLRGVRELKHDSLEQAMFLATEQLALGIQPNVLTYDRLMLVCIKVKQVDHALRYLEECESLGWLPRMGTVGALAERLAEVGDERCWDILQKAKECQGVTFKTHKARVGKTWDTVAHAELETVGVVE